MTVKSYRRDAHFAKKWPKGSAAHDAPEQHRRYADLEQGEAADQPGSAGPDRQLRPDRPSHEEAGGGPRHHRPRQPSLGLGVDPDPREADRRQHGRQARPLRLALLESERAHEERDHDQRAAYAEEPRRDAAGGADPDRVHRPPRGGGGGGRRLVAVGSPKVPDGDRDEEEDDAEPEGALRHGVGPQRADPDADEEAADERRHQLPPDGAGAVVLAHGGRADGEQEDRERHPLGVVLVEPQHQPEHRDEDDHAANAEDPGEEAGEEGGGGGEEEGDHPAHPAPASVAGSSVRAAPRPRCLAVYSHVASLGFAPLPRTRGGEAG